MSKYPECIGEKRRSKGLGRGLGIGQGKGPIGLPRFSKGKFPGTTTVNNIRRRLRRMF